MNTMIENSSAGSAIIKYVGLGKRLKAFLFDYLVIFFYILVWVGIGVSVTVTAGPLDQISPLFASPVVLDAMAFLVLILPVSLYFTLQEGSPRQATWGKRKAGIRDRKS